MNSTVRPFDDSVFPALTRIVGFMADELPHDLAVLLHTTYGNAIAAITARLLRGETDVTDMILTLEEAALFTALASEDMAAVIRLITPKEAA